MNDSMLRYIAQGKWPTLVLEQLKKIFILHREKILKAYNLLYDNDNNVLPSL